MLSSVDKSLISVGLERRGIDLFSSKKHFYMNAWILIIAASFLILLPTMQVFAQNIFINGLTLNPFVLEIALFANMISTLSTPFSAYTKNPYSSYDPFEPPYITIPNSTDFNPFPYPYKIGSTTGINFPYKTYEVYNPISFLNSGYPYSSMITLGLPSIEESIRFNLLSPFFQPGFTGLIFPFVLPGFSP
ncbi:MAG: hypothetical protein ACFFDN_19405 [Candidatus Hodarchaeota archaeon]